MGFSDLFVFKSNFREELIQIEALIDSVNLKYPENSELTVDSHVFIDLNDVRKLLLVKQKLVLLLKNDSELRNH